MASAVEDAGFEIRDQIMWVFGSGFPKSHNLEGEWQGRGTALKPAPEPTVVARKPLIGTVAENLRGHRTGAWNIDECRIPGPGGRHRTGEPSQDRRCSDRSSVAFAALPGPRGGGPAGRWPANLLHDGSDEVIAAFPDAAGRQGAGAGSEPSGKTDHVSGPPTAPPRDDSGSAVRFFYREKGSRKDRDEGCDSWEKKLPNWSSGQPNPGRSARNHHPTVKPTDLMRYLGRLVTPPGGTVLDPFMGSGSTGQAALEGFRFIGVEREREYF
jgi:hypothetical protein